MSGENQTRGWVGVVMAEGDVLAIEVEEDIRENEHAEDRGAEENKDQQKVWFFAVGLFDFHVG